MRKRFLPLLLALALCAGLLALPVSADGPEIQWLSDDWGEPQAYNPDLGWLTVEDYNSYRVIDLETEDPVDDYLWVECFSEGLAIASERDSYGNLNGGFIDKSGEIVIDMECDGVDAFQEGLAMVYDGGDYSFIDKSGEEVISLRKYSEVRSFSEGLAAVKKNGEWGYIDDSGELAIPLEFDRAYSFEDGLALVRDNGDYGFIDKLGEEVISLRKYSEVNSFSEGLAAVAKSNGKWGFIDKSGEVAIPLEYDSVNSFKDGLALVRDDEDYYFIDPSGEEAFETQYDNARSFEGGLAAVSKGNGKWGFIDASGETVIPLRYSEVGTVSEGRLCWVKDRDGRYGVFENPYFSEEGGGSPVVVILIVIVVLAALAAVLVVLLMRKKNSAAKPARAAKSFASAEPLAPADPFETPAASEIVEDEAKFCPNCGAPVTPDMQFCGNCGQSL